VDRPNRAEIFNLLWQETWTKLSAMNQIDQRRVNAMWRHAVVSWLRCQALITVTKPNETVNPKP
jgi:hypothetical protein